MDAAHRGDGPGGAQQVEVWRGRPRGPGLEREGQQPARHLLDHLLEDGPGHLHAAVALGQGHDPDRQRIPGPDTLARADVAAAGLAVEPGDLG